NRVEDARQGISAGADPEELARSIALRRTELRKEETELKAFTVNGVDRLTPESFDAELLDEVQRKLDLLTQHCRAAYKEAERQKELLIGQLTATEQDRAAYFQLLDHYRNDGLADVVTNKNDLHVI